MPIVNINNITCKKQTSKDYVIILKHKCEKCNKNMAKLILNAQFLCKKCANRE